MLAYVANLMLEAVVVRLVMATAELRGMLDDDDLREVDRELLTFLTEGRATPVACQRWLESRGKEYSRAYLQQRLVRLVEHDHVKNVFDSGLYQLVSDPRETTDSEEADE